MITTQRGELFSGPFRHRQQPSFVPLHCPTPRPSAIPDPKALAIFDLAEARWITKLSPPQIEKAKGRLRGKGTDAEKRAALALLDARVRGARGP